METTETAIHLGDIVTVASVMITVVVGLVTALREWKNSKTSGMKVAVDAYHQLLEDVREELARNKKESLDELARNKLECNLRLQSMQEEIDRLKGMVK